MVSASDTESITWSSTMANLAAGISRASNWMSVTVSSSCCMLSFQSADDATISPETDSSHMKDRCLVSLTLRTKKSASPLQPAQVHEGNVSWRCGELTSSPHKFQDSAALRTSSKDSMNQFSDDCASILKNGRPRRSWTVGRSDCMCFMTPRIASRVSTSLVICRALYYSSILAKLSQFLKRDVRTLVLPKTRLREMCSFSRSELV
jgi:hypothetical protein